MFNTTFNKEEKLWSGPKTSTLLNPNVSLGQALLRSLHLNGSKVAQISDDSKVVMTYSEIYTKTVRAADNLRKLGFQSKDIFCFIASNDHHLSPIVFASICLGCPIQPLATAFVKSELIHMLKISQPKLMFCDAEVYELARNCLLELNNEATIYTFGGQIKDSVPVEELFTEIGDDSNFSPVEVDAVNDIVAIMCSSGTTGLPKGVCLSHAIILDQLTRLPYFKSDGILFCFSSLYWITGLITLIGGSLNGSTRIITKEPYSPEVLFKIIKQYKVTFILNATHQVILALKNPKIHKIDFSSVKLYTVVGSKIGLSACTEMNKYLPNGEFNSSYGMTELCCFVTGGEMFSGRDTVGQLISGCQMKIIDENGKRLGVGEDGEICIKMTYAFSGYYHNKNSTDEAFDDEGYLLTGDVGRFDEDGYLSIVDRKKEFLKYSNFPVTPSEIEGFLTNCPDIKAVCVVGVPDAVFTDLPAAVIIRNEHSNISEQEVYDMVSENFADCKKLRGGVYFVDNLPMTPSGKIIRRHVKEMVAKKWEINSRLR